MANSYYSWGKNALYSLIASFTLSCQSGCIEKQQSHPQNSVYRTIKTTSMTSSTATSTASFPCPVDLETVLAYKEVKDGSGRPLFSDEQICELKDVPSEYSKYVIAANRIPPFQVEDILIFHEYNVRKEYAKKFGESWETPTIGRFTSFEIARFYQLGLNLEEVTRFNDTGKPNLIVVYPYSLHDKAFENPQAIKIFNNFKKYYDIWTVFASDEDDPCQEIKKISRASLFMNGHGSKDSLSFGDKSMMPAKNLSNEKLFWDKEDAELSACLENLDKKGFIFLFSCEVGSGGKSAENFCNYIADKAPGREVICAKTNVEASDIKITSYYPLKLSIDVSIKIRK